MEWVWNLGNFIVEDVNIFKCEYIILKFRKFHSDNSRNINREILLFEDDN